LTAAVWVALAAATVALIQAFFSIRQKQRELRWKQAELARELIDNLFEWPASRNALAIVDEGESDYELKGYGRHHVTPSVDIPKALAVSGGRIVSTDPKDRFIQKCFDVLFFNISRIEHSIDIGVVDRSDVLVPARYYVLQLVPYKNVLEAYIATTGFSSAEKFLRYFTEWTPSLVPSPNK
jgi:hypothetical protein